ncbi:hypothetical protein MK805_11870 [Shimazuella sp. AN120528]|uniref:hypothetical protein n=1 Tax=Shimazuella soli TaxID=1892854 RepID=UPI001F0D03E6|nr:hypothetical protein [Shimazuella soli]MCH5585641.1 hypothetical protein [Shimazuella soli]
MDTQKKELIKMILSIIKQVYQKTLQLEEVFGSQSIHIFSKSYDPLKELLELLHISGEESVLVSTLVGIYLEGDMTVDEIIIELETLTAQNV